MPRTANRIKIVLALSLLIAGGGGCITNGMYPPMGGPAAVPADTLLTPSVIRSEPPTAMVSPPSSLPGATTAGDVSSPASITNTSAPADAGSSTAPAKNAASQPNLGFIYGKTAKSDDRERNPIIVIPGVLGSRLVDDQSRRVVWGEFGGDSINPTSAGGARLLALPMQQGQKLDALRDQVRVAGTLDAVDVKLLGIPIQINAYRDLLIALGVGGYRDPESHLGDVDYGDQSYSSFQFAYDWRRDNIESARLLNKFILEKKTYIENERRKRYGADFPAVRFDIVAHSMGGLVARYFLQYGAADLPADGSPPKITWAGAEHIDRLVMIGTPNAGSLDAVKNLVHGESLSQWLPRYEPAILGTMPSLYQLLPRSRQTPVVSDPDRRPIDILDPKVWADLRWGLMDPRQHNYLRELLPEVADPNQRLQVAYDHLTKCLNRAKAFHAAMDAQATPPTGTTIHLIAGDAHPTISQFRVDRRGTLTLTEWQPGDGRVSRSSALMDERESVGVRWSPRLISPIKWSSVNFLASDHLGLTSDPGFTDNVLFLLLEAPR